MIGRWVLLLAGLTALGGCPAMQPASAPAPAVHNIDSARIFNSTGRIVDPEQARKQREAAVIDPTVVEERDDIVSIQQFWNPMPWINDAAGRPVGFRVPVYLISAQSDPPKGAFVPGTILVWMYLVDPAAPPASTSRQLLHIWELSRNDAMGFRVRKRALMGYAYYFVLKWPETMNIAGETIEIEFGYERLDKRVVLGAPQRFKVPLPPGTPRRRLPPEAAAVAAPRYSQAELEAMRRQVARSEPLDASQPTPPPPAARSRLPESRPSE